MSKKIIQKWLFMGVCAMTLAGCATDSNFQSQLAAKDREIARLERELSEAKSNKQAIPDAAQAAKTAAPESDLK